MGLLCSNYWLLEAKLSLMKPNLTNELMAIKVKNFKTIGDKMPFINTNSQKKELISFTLIVQKIQCFVVDWEKKSRCIQSDLV